MSVVPGTVNLDPDGVNAYGSLAAPQADAEGASKRGWMPVDDDIGRWLCAALEDDSVCAKMKADIQRWFASFETIGSGSAQNDQEGF